MLVTINAISNFVPYIAIQLCFSLIPTTSHIHAHVESVIATIDLFMSNLLRRRIQVISQATCPAVSADRVPPRPLLALVTQFLSGLTSQRPPRLPAFVHSPRTSISPLRQSLLLAKVYSPSVYTVAFTYV